LTPIKIRKVLSVTVFILFVLLFLGSDKLSALLAGVLLPVQFMPALIQTINGPEAAFLAGLIFILLVTLIFGRVYCSFLCPLGTLQDLVAVFARRVGLRTKYAYAGPSNSLRYSFLALTGLTLTSGSLAVVSLLDPYSLTGRIFTHFLQPLVIGIYNLGILALKPLDIYLYPKESAFVPWFILTLTAAFFLLVVFLAATRGRLYCNTMCPVGTFLGWVSRISFFRFTLNRKACSECVRCESSCKAQCIDAQTASIDMSRCIGCFNCLGACSTATIGYQRRFERDKAPVWSPARRGFVVGIVAAAAGLFAVNRNFRTFLDVPWADASPPVTPPGSVSRTRYTRACTACSLCVSVCPTQVLTPTLADFGPSGILQPKMNYEKSFCDYECNLCSRVCPTGAIGPIGLDEKKLTQIGEAELLEDICVVFVDHNNCGACGEVCPTHAIRFTDRDHILYPEIDEEYCIGCGACQLACPTTPRSIIVHAHPVHKKAEKYVSPETPFDPAKIPASEKEFPF